MKEKMRLRAHHICCEPWVIFNGRGSTFDELDRYIKENMRVGSNISVELIQGNDDICQVCPYYVGNRCESPDGNEDAVKKLDDYILGELGIAVGTTFTFGEWARLLRSKLPLRVCAKCRHKSVCAIQH